jgi:hypothetical protein
MRALLAAILASTNFIINYIDFQVQKLGRLVSPGRTYLRAHASLKVKVDEGVLSKFTGQAY